MSVVRCKVCGQYLHENFALEYNDCHYCGLRCKVQQERKDDDALRNPRPRVTYIER